MLLPSVPYPWIKCKVILPGRGLWLPARLVLIKCLKSVEKSKSSLQGVPRHMLHLLMFCPIRGGMVASKVKEESTVISISAVSKEENETWLVRIDEATSSFKVVSLINVSLRTSADKSIYMLNHMRVSKRF